MATLMKSTEIYEKNISELEARNARKANPIDMHVGMRVRVRRMLLGMSQEKLGELAPVVSMNFPRSSTFLFSISTTMHQALARRCWPSMASANQPRKPVSPTC